MSEKLGIELEAAKFMAAPWFAAVQKFWPIIWRVLLVAAIFWAGWHYGSKGAEADLETFKKDQALATAAAVTQLGKEVADRDAKLAVQERDNVQAISDLRIEQALRPPRIVRVCGTSVSTGAVPGVPTGAGSSANNAGGGTEFQSGAGRDIGPGLDRLVNRADLIATKCLGQQARSDQLAAMKPQTIPVN